MKYIYPAIKIQQSELDKPILLFGASVLEINDWAGVPQKKKFGVGAETTGFQREFNEKRLADLSKFFSNPENIIQNPLLCSTRSTSGGSVDFVHSSASVQTSDFFQFGEVQIETKDYSSLNLIDVLGDLREQLEARMPELEKQSPPASLVDSLKLAVGINETSEPENSDIDFTDNDNEIVNDDFEGVLFEESHIADFWAHVASRHEILKELGDEFSDEELLGFSKEAMLAFLKPVVLVDGQHRLVGSLEALNNELESPDHFEALEQLLLEKSPDEASKILQEKFARRLPISLLLTDSSAEQVFQFVIVNQKATPIGKPLLGTIVSTTLTNDEMSQVADRLRNAGIDLQEAQAITWLARNPESPFFDKVERGLTSEAKDLLPWTVLGGLARIFRELSGGVLFGQGNDYAAIWRQKYLNKSSLVSDHKTEGYETPAEYWSALDGPWRLVFCAFFECIKKKFGQEDTEEKRNYWGKPRYSNLFNKISLTILAADFFQALVEMKRSIKSTDEIEELVDLWLEDVNLSYFDRDWNLGGVKKDSVGIRNHWAQIWMEYRKNPSQLPNRNKYRIVKQS